MDYCFSEYSELFSVFNLKNGNYSLLVRITTKVFNNFFKGGY